MRAFEIHVSTGRGVLSIGPLARLNADEANVDGDADDPAEATIDGNAGCGDGEAPGAAPPSPDVLSGIARRMKDLQGVHDAMPSEETVGAVLVVLDEFGGDGPGFDDLVGAVVAHGRDQGFALGVTMIARTVIEGPDD